MLFRSTWGVTTNTNLELIAEAFSYGTEAVANASTHTITLADGVADGARSFYLKLTGGGQACTVTLAPNTVSKVWMIENATSYTLTLSQGSGANVAVLAGEVKMIATDGGGSSAVVYDLFTDVNLAGTTKVATLTTSGNVSVGGNLDVTGTFDLSDSNFTNAGNIQLDSISGDADTDTSITFSGSDVITIANGGTGQVTFNNGSIVPVTDNDIDLGTSSLEFKDAYFDGTVTTDALVADTADINGGTVDGATIGASSATTVKGTTITATTAFVPGTSDGATLGTSSLEFGDLFLADGGVVYLGADQDVTLTHVADTGILLNSTRQLQFDDSGTYIHQSADGVLDLVSDTEIEINATTIDINGAVDVSGEIAAASLDISGNVDIDGTTNLDAVDIDGAVQLDATLTIGADDQGYDVILYGDTASANLTWDTSADDLIFNGAAGLIVPDGQLTLGSTAVSATAAEINLIDGGTSRGTTAVASGDGILINDAGTMRMTNVDTVSTYFSSHNVGGSNIVTTGALNSGSITSGFGTIDTGSSAITTTGVITGGTLEATTDTAAGDNAAIGYTAAEGLILTGQGSTNDVTIKNDADTIVMRVPTGTDDVVFADNVTISGDLTVSGDTTTVSTTNMVVSDNLIELNNGATSNSNDSGLVIERGSTGDNAIFMWDESADTFVLGTTTATGSATGNISVTDGALQAGSLDISGNIDIDGTANLDVVDIDGAVSIDATTTVGTDNKIQFRDTGLYLHSSTDGQLDIVADTEIQIAATTVDLNGNLDVSGTVVAAGNITTSGTVEPAGDTAAGDNAAIGYTASEGLILTGQGSTSDVVIKNDADGTVFSIATGTTTGAFAGNVTIAGDLTVTGTTTQVDTVTMEAANAVVFEGATADAHETTLTVVDPTADRTINLPNVSGTLPVLAAVSTTQVTSTPEELNILDGATVVVGEINALDLGSTAVGTAIASKAVILDSNKDYTGLRNFTVTGELDAATGDFSGNVDIDGDLLVGDDLTLDSDAAILGFGADTDVTLTHVADTGLLLNSAMVVQFRDSAINIGSPADGDLDINADDEIELNSTLIDINGNVEISGTTAQVGVSTSTAKDVFNAGMSVKNGATSAGFVEFFEDSDNGSNKVTLIGPASTADVTLTLPNAAGTLSTTDDATALAIALG